MAVGRVKHVAGQRSSSLLRRARKGAFRPTRRSLVRGFACLAAIAACSTERADPAPAPTWTDDVEQVLRAKCAGCHAGPAPAGGWRASRFVDAVACTADGEPATIAGAGGEPPILAALARPDHQALLTERELALVKAWVAAGTPAFRGGVHASAFADPRSPEGHGRLLRARAYRPMTDAEDKDACRTCHAGVGETKAALPAPGATACTTCHTDPGGPFACTTCHGQAAAPGRAARPYPPRDPCFHPAGAASAGAHAAHAEASPSRGEGLACVTCHPTPEPGVFAPPHADGTVSVWFGARTGSAPTFDATSKRCTGTCHARGGARPELAWTETTKVGCNDCHASPPPAHYQGACTSCHAEANAKGDALLAPKLHVNGRVDLGDGSGACGACHGRGADPWPTTGAHLAHAAPRGAQPVPCGTCHEVPDPSAKHPVGKGGATVRLTGLASRAGRAPTFDTTTKACAGTYCHDSVGAGVGQSAPRWTDGPAAVSCGSCHAAPPPLPHIQETNCALAGCHEGLTTTDGKAMTTAGRALHVNGLVDRP